MKCADVEDALLDYLEGQLAQAESAAMRAHFAGCHACQSALEDVREMLGMLESARSCQERVWRDRSGAGRTSAAFSAVAPPAPGWQPGMRLGDFEILGEIGRGGMGVVFRAMQTSLNRVVALKVMPGVVASSASAVTRFQREAQAAAKLHHTNIVPVYAQGEQDGHFYYAMELIDGVNLGSLIRQYPHDVLSRLAGDSLVTMSSSEESAVSSAITTAPTPRRVRDYRRLARLLADVADGLDHAHRQNVIHRDIKPQNLMLGRDGALHITDFGLARLLDEPNVTVTGEMLGTPAYMSPEQVDSDRDRIDHRTDIYSLGVTLYELLAGRRPFEGTTREQIIARIRTREPRPPRKCNADVPLDLDTICLRAMEKNPARRYASAADMAADLRRYADDRPIVSRRVGPLEKAVKWVRRHPALTTILFLCALLLAGTGLWTRQYLHQRYEGAMTAAQRAFDLLVFDDYRDVAGAKASLNDAHHILRDEPIYLAAMALCNILDHPTTTLETVNRVLQTRPDDTELHYLRAWALRRLERRAEYEDAIRLADEHGGPQTAAAHFFRAQALVRERPDDAVENYRTAAALRKDNYQAVVHLGRCQNHWTYHHRRRDRYEELTRSLLAACTLRPDKAYPRYLLSIGYRLSAEMHRDDGNDADASRDFEAALNCAAIAIDNEPDSPRGYAAEAELWESVNDLVSALDARNRGLLHCRTNDEFIEFLSYRWRIYFWLNELDKARADLARLAELATPADPRRHWYEHLFPALINADSAERSAAIEQVVAAARHAANERSQLDAAAVMHWLGEPVHAAIIIAGFVREPAAQPDDDASTPRDWHRLSRGLLSGEHTFDDLTDAADREYDKSIWAAPHFFAAAVAFSSGNDDAVNRHLAACEATYDFDDYCYLARVISRRIAADPGWPRRLQPPR